MQTLNEHKHNSNLVSFSAGTLLTNTKYNLLTLYLTDSYDLHSSICNIH